MPNGSAPSGGYFWHRWVGCLTGALIKADIGQLEDLVLNAQGHETDKGSYEGKDIGADHRWTDVLVTRVGRWQEIAWQGTGIGAAKP